ncbi:MAG TPA: nitrilase-related carbon-nitrogen hydrolase, partial [Anaeromyxobacteraceae bacterium]|nr:nitrilase-related carbon-nitrogen hydrolase [Anaeromyxobacteraceae bacterium]
MSSPARIALAQINTTVGDYVGNALKVRAAAAVARRAGARLVLFPELTLCGYPPRDFLDL